MLDISRFWKAGDDSIPTLLVVEAPLALSHSTTSDAKVFKVHVMCDSKDSVIYEVAKSFAMADMKSR
jgi:hypothetical protein